MTLLDLLEKLAPETKVGIWNIDDRRSKCPTPQTYQKVKNVTWGKIKNIVYYEVMGIYPVEKSNGLLIKVYDKERLTKSLDHSDLARKIREMI